MTANEKITALDRDKKLFLIGMTAISVLTNPVGMPLMISALMAGYSSIADYFWDYRVGMIQGCEPIDGVFSENNEHGAGWIPLTQEYLKENNNVISQSGKYYLAEDISVLTLSTIYNEPQIPIDVTICLHGHNVEFGISTGSGMNIGDCSWSLSDCKYIEKPDGTVSGGRLIGSLGDSVSNGGTLLINNCIVEGNVCNFGKMTITGGTFTGGGGNVYSITNLSGTMNITGGTIINSKPYAGSISNGGWMVGAGGGAATLNISGGTVLNTADRCCCIHNYSEGTVNITGGTIKSTGSNVNRCVENYGTLIIDDGLLENSGASNRDGVIGNAEGGILKITGGNLKASGVNGFGVSNQGEMLLSGGAITAAGAGIGNSGRLEMKKGTVESKTVSAIGNLGEMTLSGGTVKATGDVGYGLTNSNTGILSISGGILQGESGSLSSNGSTTISHGTFLGLIYNPSGLMKFRIGETSRIEITAPFNAVVSSAVMVEAASGYDGGIKYYDTVAGEGTPMTLEQVAEALAEASGNYQQYVRLVASKATDEPDPGENPDCQHNYTTVVTAPTCTERGYTTHICSKCNNSYVDSYINALGHSYGEWTTTIPATTAANGQREHTCSRCGHKEVDIIPATGNSGSSGSGNSSFSGNSGGGSSSGYSISTPSRTPNGKIRTSPSSAEKGDTVTIAVTPNTGYKLDRLTVTDTKGNEVSVREQDNGKFTFIMPASKVSVDVTFVKIENTPTQPTGPSISFTDVASSAYYADAVAWAVEKGITVGTSTTTFSPDAPCTRAQIVTFLWRAAGSPSMGGNNPFTDVAPGSYYCDAVQWAVAQGISVGTSATTFSPDATCTRGQTVTFLYRYEKSPAVSGGNAFTDVPSDAYYTNAVQWAVNNGVTSGTSETTFSPNATCARGQIVTFLYRDMA